MPTAYCLACDWERDAADDEITDLGRSMIDHHIETGHSPIEQRPTGSEPAATETTTRVLYDDHSDRDQDDRAGHRQSTR